MKRVVSVTVFILIGFFCYLKIGSLPVLLAMKTGDVAHIAYFEAKQLQPMLQESPDDTSLLARYLSARSISTHGILSADDHQTLQHYLLLAPTAFVPRNLLAVDAYQRGDYDKALNLWESLAKDLSGEEMGPVERAIANARARRDRLMQAS